jgi:hypothetical protein
MTFLVGDQLRLPVRTSDPGSPAEGDTYFNGTTNLVRVYDGAAWMSLAAAGTGAVLYDTGWYAEEATTNHYTTKTHSLALDLRTPPADLEVWFSPTTPLGGSSPATIYKKPLRGMQLDDAGTTAQGYDNPAFTQLNVNTILMGFYSALPLHSVFDPVAAGWTHYQTGWFRCRLRAT